MGETPHGPGAARARESEHSTAVDAWIAPRAAFRRSPGCAEGSVALEDVGRLRLLGVQRLAKLVGRDRVAERECGQRDAHEELGERHDELPGVNCNPPREAAAVSILADWIAHLRS